MVWQRHDFSLATIFPQRTNRPKAARMTHSDPHSDTVSPETVSFGYEEVSPEEKTAKVGEVFSSVAKKYDIMNDAMSVGMHRLWKDKFVRRVKPQPGEMILDMAGGTGDIAFRMARRGALITVSDINADMLEVGKQRAHSRALSGLSWKVENAGKTIVFQLRQGILFSDGTPFSAEDVVHTMKVLLHTRAH